MSHSIVEAGTHFELKRLYWRVSYPTFMVKPLADLALRVLASSEALTPHLIRIQHGFMPNPSIYQAEQQLRTMLTLIEEMKVSAQTRNPFPRALAREGGESGS